MKKIILESVLFAFVLTLGATAAQASPIMLKLEVLNATTLVFDEIGVFQDGGPGDTSSLLNVLLVKAGSIGQLSFSNTTAMSVPAPTDIAKLTLNSVNIQALGAVTLRMTAVNTNLTSPYIGQADVDARVGGLLIGSSINVQSWVYKSSTALPPPPAFPTTPLAGSLEVYGPGGVSATGGTGGAGTTFAFVDANNVSLNLSPNEYISLITQATITFDGAGSSARLTYDDLKVVPEPASLLLIGSGVLGLATVVRRRKKKRTEAASC